MIVSVFEFGYLGTGEKARAADITVLPFRAFDYLEKLCLQQNENCPFLKLKSRNGVKVLQVQNYAGVIQTPDGCQIEVLPKIARKQDPAESRDALLTMLMHLGQFRHIETSDANIRAEKMPLLEVFIRQFLQSVNKLVKRGLRSDYIRQENNLAFMKGKLMVGKQLRDNFVNKHKFYVAYDEFLQDRPANRLIKTALGKVGIVSRSADTQKLLRELMFAFDEVPFSRDVKSDFKTLRLDRGMDYYNTPLAWARLIFDGLSPLTMQGEENALSLLFPMESIFESYVASQLPRQLPNDMRLKCQAASMSLVSHNGAGYFRLKPDLLVQMQHSGQTVAVLDTKWKLIEPSLANSREKYGLSQADFYQMFAYGHKYLHGAGELYLIYPAHDEFQSPIPYSFDFSDRLTLWVVPFRIARNGRSGIVWPDDAFLSCQQKSTTSE